MSSHRRSNHRPPTWSQRSAYKPHASTGVSIIYAQPLQGSPLRSAIDNLPSIGIDDSASFISEMSRKREHREEVDGGDELDFGRQKEEADERSIRSARGSFHSAPIGISESVALDASSTPAPQVIDLTGQADGDAPGTSSAAVLLTESPKTASELALPEPSTPTVSLPPTSNAPKSRRSSWFSFSKPKDILAMSVSVPESSAMAPPPQAALKPSSASVIEVAPGLENSSAPPLVGVTQSDPRSSTTKTSPESVPAVSPAPDLQTSPPTSPLPLATSNTTSTISSVDDEVPPHKPGNSSTLLPESSSAVLQSQDLSVPGRKPSISSLNPSSSRFMLRIPLLGRPKVPLDQAVAASQSTESVQSGLSPQHVPSGSSEPSLIEDQSQDIPQTIATPVSSDPPLPIPSTSESSIKDPSQDLTPKASDPQSAAPASSSWWSYLGYSDDSAPAQVPEGSVEAPMIPEAEAQSGTSETTVQDPTFQTDASQSPPVPAESAQVAVGLQPIPVQPEIQITASSSDERPQSLLSAETAQSQGSAWYSPWAWYGPSSSSSSVPAVPSTEAEKIEEDETAGHVKTESEMVKEEALAREDTTPTNAQTPTMTEPTPTIDIPIATANPIESSISTNRSGWASFFMSRALLTKTITDDSVRRDENGVEVMDIEEEEGQETTAPDATPGMPSSPRSGVSVAGNNSSVIPTPKSPTLPKQPRDSKKSASVAPPLTSSESVKKETMKANPGPRSASPAPSTKKSGSSTPIQPKPQPPNLVLPTWDDTFRSLPRSFIPPPPSPPKSTLSKTLSVVSGVLFSAKDDQKQGSVKGKERQSEYEYMQFGKDLPKAFDVLGQTLDPSVMSGNCRIVVIGVAGWSPGAVTRTLAGGLPSSSSKFVDMTCSALEKFEMEHGVKFKKITKMPLEGDGMIPRKVEKVHAHLLESQEWMDDLHAADVIFVATHSQGSIVSTHLLERLIREGHIMTPRNVDILTSTAAAIAPGGSMPASSARTQKICCLALCGIHLGPLRYLKTSSLLQPYIQYFENAAARELFEFQDTETDTHKDYVKALRTVMDHGSKMVYIASLNDQVVPIYSGLFTAASHPRILRALYIDGDAYQFVPDAGYKSCRIMNIGLPDSGLLAHLSEATAGTLSGIGHSTAYEELATYSLAVDYLFLVNDGADVRTDLTIEPFNAVNEQNDYEIPWSLRDLIADERVAHFFAQEFGQLRDAFDDWQPRTSILRDIKRKLQPIQRLSSIRERHYIVYVSHIG
ncbi:hypothetical protein EIP91_004885 [Steccherinum ochraceum]|uniref:YMC020W-like alpha/beta hydrolase domain-containing protein n=1 Tax=Steccherinum ochraceum TaxID=92696 RepID=A0A4R0RB16_9APHY|nr:hypothetical protein EIP91_004885 [Steccherinum ochraceum]